MSSARLIGAAAITAALFACGGGDTTSPASTAESGSIIVSTVTTGHDLDPDGYLVTVDQQPARVIAATGSLTIDGAALGAHRIVVSGLAENCRSDTTQITKMVTPSAPAHVAFTLGCVRRELHNAILYTSEDYGLPELFAMNPDGSEAERITRDQQGYAAPSVSPDGTLIAFARLRDGIWSIYVIGVDGKNLRRLPTPGHLDGSPSWSPDGTAIAFRSELSGPYGDFGRIFIMNADGSQLRQLSPDVASDAYVFDDSPSWSPDGSMIVFSRNGGGYTINLAGTVLTPLGIGCEYPAWSPDGNRIACTASVEQNMDVYVMDANGSNNIRLTTYAGQDQSARWSADGSQLVFMRVINGEFQIVRINSDGTGEAQLTHTSFSEAEPSWAR